MTSPPTALDTESPIACPHCQKKFRLPDGFNSTNALACPHCEEKVTGEQILDSVAPTASLIENDPADSVAIDTGAAPARRSHPIDEQDFSIPKPLKTATRRRGRSSTPPRKRSSSKKAEPKNELARILFGGLLALPIAQMLLWWMFAQDPLGLAAPISRYVPFVVPEKLRPADEISAPTPKRDLDMPPSQNMRDDERVPYNVIPGQ